MRAIAAALLIASAAAAGFRPTSRIANSRPTARPRLSRLANLCRSCAGDNRSHQRSVHTGSCCCGGLHCTPDGFPRQRLCVRRSGRRAGRTNSNWIPRALLHCGGDSVGSLQEPQERERACRQGCRRRYISRRPSAADGASPRKQGQTVQADGRPGKTLRVDVAGADRQFIIHVG